MGVHVNWWLEHAWLPPGVLARRVHVTADTAANGRIVSVEADVDPPAGVQRLRGIVLPGLANAHSHAFHRALRGRTHEARGTFWSWRDDMYAVAARLDPDTYLDLARAAYAEMALAGITCVGEFHYLHHAPDAVRYADPNAMGAALCEAAAQAGVRLTLLDACYLAGGFDEQLRGVQLRFGDRDVDGWANRASAVRADAQVRVGAAIHSVRAVPATAFATVAQWALERDVPLHAHVSEQVAENQACIARHGRAPVALLADAGVLSASMTAVHATHLDDGDIAALAQSGAGVCLCPTTERDLADGAGPASPLAEAGVPISLGSDSHAVIDLFEEARGVELDERLRTQRRGSFAASQLLGAATVTGHRALGWHDAGAIAVGCRADFVAVSLDSVRLAGIEPSAQAVVFAATAADVTDVIVDGRVVVRDRQHMLLGDVGPLLGKAIAAVMT